jgi:AhpD family alkylhydroperoxidase
MKYVLTVSSVALLAVLAVSVRGDETKPKPIPATRPAAKLALEALKARTPRLLLPALTDAEIEEAKSSGRSLVNNGRMRSLYLPAELGGGNRGRSNDPAMQLDQAFGVELFWIASRVNNCHYCLGHQENKLLAAGVPETRIAALDCDWSKFSEAEKAAYAFARELTERPDLISDGDVERLKKHYSPLQCLEIVFLVARYNATNRWTDSLGIPQEDHRDFLTETPAEFQATPSVVAPKAVEERLPLLPRQQTLDKLRESRSRKCRLPLTAADAVSALVAADLVSSPPPQWTRLLANFPVAGKGAIETYALACTKGTLKEELKAQIAWTAAREDRAWYALHHAKGRLERLGYTEDQVFALDNPEGDTSADKVRAFARKLTSTPQLIVDADIDRLREDFSDQQVAETVYQVTQAAFFDRLTEAAGCGWDDE